MWELAGVAPWDAHRLSELDLRAIAARHRADMDD